MRQLFIIVLCLVTSIGHTQDERVLPEMSFTEFFEAIETSTDSIFTLSDALIVFDETKDQRFKKPDSLSPKRDTIYVNKPIKLDYVHFDRKGSLNYISFKESVTIVNPVYLNIEFSKFNKGLSYFLSFGLKFFDEEDNEEVENKDPEAPKSASNFDERFRVNSYYDFFPFLIFKNNVIHGETVFDNYYKISGHVQGSTIVESNIFDFRKLKRQFFSTPLICSNINSFNNNTIYNDYQQVQFGGRFDNFENNNFQGFGYTFFDSFGQAAELTNIKNNKLNYFTSFKFEDKGYYDWNDLKDIYLFSDGDTQFNFFKMDSIESKNYAENRLITDEKFHSRYLMNLEKLQANFKTKRNFKSANAVYVTIKDHETDRLRYIYQQERDFDTFFQWQVNRFVGMFSDYGTKPSKAIVISMYVILIFALFYFLFPNNWDSSGKNRLINRYNFFMKYLNIDSGMHEIYQDETKKKLLEYEEFKNFIETSKHSTPKFFKATALPLYRWSILGSKFTASVLKRFDILHGTWQDVPKRHKWWKGLIIILVFIIAVLYDLLIKFLNALMLSINTFSTLGFGEIPIKGLPRYLAIIQGFIGWFMLTIFSVSLISQLLS